MSWLDNIKQGFKKKPFKTVWKLLWLIPVLCVGLMFALSLVVINLGLAEAEDFLSQLI